MYIEKSKVIIQNQDRDKTIKYKTTNYTNNKFAAPLNI